MTNDHRKGAAYKLRTDANARRRRKPSIRRKVEAFRRKARAPSCTSRARTTCAGPLEVHHVGGLSSRARLQWRCRKHNRSAAGQKMGRGKTKPSRG